MNKIENKKFEQERELYNSKDLIVDNCVFEGEADGESPLKESTNVELLNSKVSLRYALWHDNNLVIKNSELTDKCRAPLWYSNSVYVENSVIHSVKPFRECKDISIVDTKIPSEEAFWNCSNISVTNSFIGGNIGFLRCDDVTIYDSEYDGKYSFQYCKNVSIYNSKLNVKDAFWHAKNVVLMNCDINGWYIGWYSENLTLINCRIESIQPFCYCKNLVIENCELINCNDAFEYSEVKANFKGTNVIIKNPLSGTITCNKEVEVIYNKDSKFDCKCIIKKAD